MRLRRFLGLFTHLPRLSGTGLLGSLLGVAGGTHLVLAQEQGVVWVQGHGQKSWGELVSNSQSALDPSRLPDTTSSRLQLERAVESLDAFLASSPSHGPRWRSLLRLDALKSELANPTPNLEVLNDIEKSFRQNYAGLELPQFTSVRDGLSKFVPAQRVAGNPEATMEILRNRLNRLGEKSQLPEIANDSAALHEMAQTVAYLHHGNQAPELVSTVRNAFAHSNVRVLFGRDFVENRFARPVDQHNPVNELILGTTIRGQSQLLGTVRPQLLENTSQAALRLNLAGDFSSLNRGYNRSVVLNTQGHGNIVAGETIAVTENGLVALGDTSADADLRTTINSIEHQLKIVRKIAAKQAAKKKSQAEAIGESRLENRLRHQFHEQLQGQLSDANSRLDSAGRTELIRLGLQKPHRRSWSSLDRLAVLWNVRSGVQLAAQGSCPLPVDHSGMTVQIHQSVVGNLLDPVLAGRILRSEDMDGYIAQFGEAAKRIPRKEQDGPWSITMNGFQPVEMLLDDSLIRFRIRTSKLEREDQSLEQLAIVDAAYRVEIVDGAIQLHREGEVNVEFTGKQQKGVRSVTLRTFLKNKFEQLFRPQLFDTSVNWSEKLPDQFQDLQLASLAIDDGWMQVHLK